MEELGQEMLLSFTKKSEISRVLSVSLRFLGWMTREDLGRNFLPTLDVLLNPSVTPETFCIANAEAMAVGVPVVSFGLGGVGEYLNKRVNGTAGFVVGAQGHTSDATGEQWPRLMARLAVYVLTMDPRSIAKLRESSSEHMKQYDVEISVLKVGRHLQEAADSRRGRIFWQTREPDYG